MSTVCTPKNPVYSAMLAEMGIIEPPEPMIALENPQYMYETDDSESDSECY